MANVKEVNIKGENYTLTANRRLIKVIAKICPSLIKLDENKAKDNDNIAIGIDIYADLDVLFYEMIKPAHPNLTKEESDKILENFEDEYADVANNIVNFAMSSFTQGDQKEKKKLNW